MKYAKVLHYASIGILFRIDKTESFIDGCLMHNFPPFGDAEKQLETLEIDLAAVRKLQAQEDTQ